MNGEAIREFLVAEVRPAVLGVYKPNSCVATVRVTNGVLDYLGVKAKPWPCSLLVANKAGARILVDGADLLPDEIAQLRDAGGWAVEVAGSDAWDRDADRWDGHLVTLAQFDDGVWLLDLSLDQARRSTRQIDVRPVAVRARSMSPAEPIVSRVESCLVRWTGIESHFWRRHRDWKRDHLTGPVTSHLIHHARAIRDGLECCKDCGHATDDHEYDVAGKMVCMILPGEGPIGCRICRTTHKRIVAALAGIR